MKTHREFINDRQKERYLRLRWSPTRDDSEDDLRSDDPWDEREPGDADDYLLTALWNRIKCTPRLEERFPKEIVLGPRSQSRVNSSPTTRVTAELLAHELSLLTSNDQLWSGDAWGLVANQDPLPPLPDVRRALRVIWDLDGNAPDARADALLDKTPALMMAFFFSRFWVRQFHEWVVPGGDSIKRIRSLVAHLFVKFPVPGWLYENWYSQTLPSIKWVLWLILIGQGASLHRAAAVFGWRIPKGFQSHLMFCPHLPPVEACIWSEIMRIGGSGVEYIRLRNNRGFVLDPTDPSLSDSHLKFWRGTVKWLIRHREELTDETCYVILDWAMHQHTESEAHGLPPYSWKGRSVSTAFEKGLEYRRSLKEFCARYDWESHGWNFRLTSATVTLWSVVELTNDTQLYEEGEELNHCVVNYAARCVAGQSAIFSLRRNENRTLTIELDPISRKLVQVCGKSNRTPASEEQAIVDHWCTNVVNRNAKTQE